MFWARQLRHPVSVMPIPTGTVTFLLTDVEGSSRLWEGDDGTVGPAVARHYEILDAAITAHAGTRPLEQGEGDSVVAAFARPSDALAAALAAQRALMYEAWPTDRPVRVRMAIHTGEAQLRDDANYMGPAMNRTARLRELAHGGQVLVSSATQELLGDRLPERAVLDDLGSHRLRDLGRQEHVFQLWHPELPREFPPLRSVDARPNNLPAQLTTFIGREDEIAALRKAFADQRLVTITGSGGCGKTRLALQVAAQVLDDHPDGTWWVDLAPVADPGLVATTVANALGIREVPGERAETTVARLLASRRCLVILDNCEHLIDACAALAHTLLVSCPGVVVVATSREPLGVDGEITWRLPSLTVPSDDVALHALDEYEAVRLFVDRAVRARPTFALTADTAPAVVQICRRLDGIPLAIELAAARARALSPTRIAEALDERFRLLAGGARTAMPRQRTLEASVGWSYTLLDEHQRRLFGRLSVFAGTFALDSAEAVCSGDGLDAYEVFDLLLQLVDRSLVQVDEGDRYRLLETVRQYGRLKLVEAGESDDVRARHLEHFTDLVERAQSLVESGGTAEWLDRLERDFDNIRGALEWSLAAGRAADGLRLATAWPERWAFSGRIPEGLTVIQGLMGAAAPEGRLLAQSLVALQTITAYGAVDLEQSLTDGKRGLALAEEAGDDRLAARARVYIAFAEGMLDPTTAVPSLEAAAAATVAVGDSWAARHALNWVGFNRLALGEVEAAQDVFAGNIASARADGDLIGLRTGLYFAGLCSWALGRSRHAEAEMREGLGVASTARDRLWVPMIAANLAIVLTSLGQYEEAELLADRSARDAADTGNPFARALAMWGLAWLRSAQGDDAAAKEAAAEATASFAAAGPPWAAAMSCALLARATAETGDVGRAYALIDEALDRAGRSAPAIGRVLTIKALIAQAAGELDVAEDAARRAVGYPDTLSTIDALEALGCILVEREDHAEGTRLLGAAARARADSGLVRWPSLDAAHADAEDAARRVLGDEQFRQAWASGQACDLPEAVAQATRGRGPRGRPASGWDSLTPTELDVVRLVAEGLTNPQIGERLFISRGTVKTHLAHVFAKVGVSTRAELATEATRRQR
ncbi:MAG: hypothetical protein QOE35_3416 [Actinomycetota bacterium]|jgi:predicted ATPase/class 3 adenylate cyclase/DNA-binding CsgD family transcriptional regulator